MKPSIEKRFWSFVSKSDRNSCWIWKGSTANKGYGTLSVSGKSKRAHRVSYEIAFGVIPNGMEICHSCDNPSCVNPAHLFAGSHAENMKDSYAKGRTRVPPERGFINGNAKKTHCLRGHEFSPENTYYAGPRKRHCITCANDRQRLAKRMKRDSLRRITHNSDGTVTVERG